MLSLPSPSVLEIGLALLAFGAVGASERNVGDGKEEEGVDERAALKRPDPD